MPELISMKLRMSYRNCSSGLEAPAIVVAAADSNTAMVEVLMKYGNANTAKISSATDAGGGLDAYGYEEGDLAVHTASSCGNTKVLETLINGGTDVNVANAVSRLLYLC